MSDLSAQTCPLCGGPVELGFGLAGGGYGPYIYCVVGDCEWFYKEQEDIEK